jgi:hypothetical protein
VWRADPPNSTSESSKLEVEQVKKKGPVKPKSNSKLRPVWQKKVAPPLEAPLIEAPPQESSSSRANQGTQSKKTSKGGVLSGGRKILNPYREVTSVVIHIYLLSLHELF